MQKLIFALLTIMILMISGCGNKASYGDGDEKFTVDLVDGSYELNGLTNKAIQIKGSVNLKICNEGQKPIPFAISGDVGGILTEFKEEHIAEVKSTAVEGQKRIAVSSNEGLVTILPGNCPTYEFVFNMNRGIKYDEEDFYFSMDAYKEADYYFFLGQDKWKLEGTDNLVPLEEKVAEKGFAEEDYKDFIKDLDKGGMDLGMQYCMKKSDAASMNKCADLTFKLAVLRHIPEKDAKYCELVKAKDLCIEALSESEENLLNELEA